MRLEHVQVVSTNIGSVGYDPNQAILEVSFKGGATYRYYGVPRARFAGLLKARSAGKYFHARIRDSFKWRRV
jgi:hypothetical protein